MSWWQEWYDEEPSEYSTEAWFAIFDEGDNEVGTCTVIPNFDVWFGAHGEWKKK